MRKTRLGTVMTTTPEVQAALPEIREPTATQALMLDSPYGDDW